jgi:hypothetical protein
MSDAELIELIQSAWRLTERPPDFDRLLTAYTPYQDTAEERAVFVGVDWRTVAASLAAGEERFVLGAIPDETFAYYLGGFLCGAVESWNEELVRHLVEQLTPPKKPEHLPRFTNRVDSLNRPKRRAVCEYLLFVCDRLANGHCWDLSDEHCARMLKRTERVVQQWTLNVFGNA